MKSVGVSLPPYMDIAGAIVFESIYGNIFMSLILYVNVGVSKSIYGNLGVHVLKCGSVCKPIYGNVFLERM